MSDEGASTAHADPPEAVTDAARRLTPGLWAELRRIARREHRRVGAGETLRPTVLVSEAWLRLRRSARELDDTHFLHAAALAMRHVLVDHARRRLAAKRGGGRIDPLDEEVPPFWESDERLVELDEALERLTRLNPRLARVTELRFFAGYGETQIAGMLGLTDRTVRRDWVKARAWLYRELSPSETAAASFNPPAIDNGS